MPDWLLKGKSKLILDVNQNYGEKRIIKVKDIIRREISIINFSTLGYNSPVDNLYNKLSQLK